MHSYQRSKILFVSPVAFPIKVKNAGVQEFLSSQYEALQSIYGRENVIVFVVGFRYTSYKKFGICAFLFFHLKKWGLTKKSQSSIVLKIRKNRLLERLYFLLKEIDNLIIPLFVRNRHVYFSDLINKMNKYPKAKIFFAFSLYGFLIKVLAEKNPKMKLVSAFHNIEKSMLSIYMNKLDLVNRVYWVQLEKLTCRYSSDLIFLSRKDYLLAQKKFPSERDVIQRTGHILPMYLECSYDAQCADNIHSTHSHQSAVKVLIFVASDWPPNVKGIEWFIKHVLPSINVTLLLVGKVCNSIEAFPSSVKDKIRKYGFVEKERLGACYQEADICIAPLFEGGGMKVKVVEALSRGKVVVATKEALTGFDFPSDNDFAFECNTKEAFIITINKLISVNQNSFSEKVIAFFRRHHSKEAAMAKIQDILER